MAKLERPNGPALQPTSLVTAIAAALSGTHTASAQEGADARIEEVIVTATKREESIQDIAQSVQAFSQADIERQGLNGLDDYIRFIPSMSYITQGPGLAKIVFRGVADAAQPFIAQSSSSVYLDEQPLTQGSQQPEVRLVDVERIEALSGPQGTLYGDSSQSGTLRIVTNKPDPTAFAADFDVELRTGDDSSESYDVSAMVNIPLVDGRFAIRVVGFDAHDGGYIDNVLGTTPRFGLHDNANAVADDINDVDTTGGRIAARWFLNDTWSTTLAAIFQESDADSLNEFDPTVGDLEVVRFFNETRKDDWQQFALTFDGDLGFAQFVSATAYFTRDIDYVHDRTSYSSYFSTFCFQYDANTVAYPAYCFGGPSVYENDPAGFSRVVQENTRFTQEFRLSASGPKWEWIAGLFYEDRTEQWDYKTFVQDYQSSLAFTYWSALYNLPPTVGSFWWNSGDDTQWEQWAVFGEATYHFNERWSVTFGGRLYDTTFDKIYFVERPNDRLDAGSNPDGDPPGFSHPDGSDSGFLPKLSVEYAPDDSKLFYGLYSEGFRAGGANRGRGDPDRVVTPFAFEADILKNFELGAKTQWLDGRLIVNVAAFHMMWEDYQLEFNDPSFNFNPPEPFQTVVGNAGDAVIDGIEVSLTAVIGPNWDLGLNATVLDAQVDEDIDFCTAVADPAARAQCQASQDPIPKGSDLPLTPDFKGSAFLQYSWNIGNLDAYLLAQWSYTGSSLNQVQDIGLPAPRLEQAAYDIGDLKFGLGGETWNAALFVNNVTDERPEIFVNAFDLDYFFGRARVATSRPREYGIKFSKRWR